MAIRKRWGRCLRCWGIHRAGWLRANRLRVVLRTSEAGVAVGGAILLLLRHVRRAGLLLRLVGILLRLVCLLRRVLLLRLKLLALLHPRRGSTPTSAATLHPRGCPLRHLLLLLPRGRATVAAATWSVGATALKLRLRAIHRRLSLGERLTLLAPSHRRLHCGTLEHSAAALSALLHGLIARVTRGLLRKRLNVGVLRDDGCFLGD